MTYNFAGYIADLVLQAQKARNDEQPITAGRLDAQLQFAVHDAVRHRAIDDLPSFYRDVVHQVVDRGGSDLHALLSSAKTEGLPQLPRIPGQEDERPLNPGAAPKPNTQDAKRAPRTWSVLRDPESGAFTGVQEGGNPPLLVPTGREPD